MEPAQACVLLAEDDGNDVVLIRRAFGRAGLQGRLEQVDDGQALVDYLAGSGEYADRRRHPLPALIMLDLKMPRRSGHEALEWLRAQPGLRRIPAVVLTTSQQQADVDRAYELGANAYLIKPLGQDRLVELLAVVRRYWLELNLPPTPSGG